MSKSALNKLQDLLMKCKEPYEYTRPKNLTLLMIREIEHIYSYLRNKQKVTFLISDLVPYLAKCGIKVDKQGIGYVAYL